MQTTTMNDDDIASRARRRVGAKVGFYVHVLVYVLVNLGLLALNELLGGHRWSVWPAWGWGLGLAIHGVVTRLSLQGGGWRDRMLAQEIERLRRSRD